MGGRPLVARLGATGRAFLLAASAISLAPAEAAWAQSGALAAVDLTAPAASDEDTPRDPAGLEETWVGPAAGGDTEAVAQPAAGALTDPGRDPADEADIAATKPGAAEQPAGTASAPEAGEEKPAQAAALPPAEADQPSATALPAPSPAEPPASDSASTPADADAPSVASEPPPAHPIVAKIRLKLNDPALRKGAAEDLAALESFYGERTEPPLWITTVGFSSKAQALIAEIQKAADWGLPAEAFDLPPAADLPASIEAQAVDEIMLSLAVLKYARFARGGRVSPSRISNLFDQASNLLDPNEVLREIAASADPAGYLVGLQPKHDQFEHLRKALGPAVAAATAKGRRPAADGTVQRIIVNMERWRWMPRDLGSYYVWNNVPAFSARVMKDGKSIYVEKAIVGQVKYATPIFSADMRSIVFNPEWVVPQTIKTEDLQPRLRQTGRGGLPDVAVLRENKLTVSFQGKPVDATSVDWNRESIHKYTFTQAPGPSNVLGTLKFNFPNRHAIYMHDTVQRGLFNERVRTLSHGCIRVHQPDRLAALLLAADKGWSADQVKAMLAKGHNTGVTLSRPVPVHLTYFTMAVDGVGQMRTYDDVYGIDAKMAQALFGKSELLSVDPAPQARKQKRSAANSRPSSSFLPGLFGN